MQSIRKVVVLGGSGRIGALVGGIAAQNGLTVSLLSRDRERAKSGLARAMTQARSDAIARNVVCADYDAGFEKAVSEADWVFECASEDLAVKKGLLEAVEALKKPDAIVSTTTSSLPLSMLVEGRSESFRQHFLAAHFFNPPNILRACEVACLPDTSPEVIRVATSFLVQNMGRIVVPVSCSPGYAGNRIGFLILCEAANRAATLGVAMMDCLMGPYTGRAMAPLATLDLVGLDITQAIAKNIHAHTNDTMHESFRLPDYVARMVGRGQLGNKTARKGGFYRKDEEDRCLALDPVTLDYREVRVAAPDFVTKAVDRIRVGRYRAAFDCVAESNCAEADVVRRLLCAYVSYAYQCVGIVTDAALGIDGIDTIMTCGFRWAAPSTILEMLGGHDRASGFLRDYDMPVPDAMKAAPPASDPGKGQYFVAL